MEKIIAVVIMLVIVMGLIATVVLPYVENTKQSGARGAAEQKKLAAQLGGTTVDGIVSEFRKAESDSKYKVYVDTNLPSDYTIAISDTSGVVTVDKAEYISGTANVKDLRDESKISSAAVFKTDEAIDADGVRHLVYYRINTAQ